MIRLKEFYSENDKSIIFEYIYPNELLLRITEIIRNIKKILDHVAENNKIKGTSSKNNIIE